MIIQRYTRYFRPLALGLGLALCLPACQKQRLQTVETGEVLYPEQDPSYKFSRNQESSVDYQEAELVASVLTELHERFLDQARVRDETQRAKALSLLEEGLYGYAPLRYVATSPLSEGKAEAIKADLKSYIDGIARISGLGAANPTLHRRQEAEEGQTGYISGRGQSGTLSFADERGVVLSEAFRLSMLGAINLDQILSVHLDDAIIRNEVLRYKHENHELQQGSNYTELEHHWDLAYGYYLAGLRPLCVADNIKALRGVVRKLDLAFTLGRIDPGYHLYDELPKHVATIRRELARVLVIRLEHSLLGGNTLANLREEPRFAFSMLSQGYGYLYALQFLRDAEGRAYFSYDEVRAWQAEMLGARGLWDKEALIGADGRRGKLEELVKKVKGRIASQDLPR